MTDRELWTAASALVLPLFISVAQQPEWSSRQRAIVAFIGVLLWTLLGALYLGDGVPQSVRWQTWLTFFLWNLIASAATFRNLWSQLGWSQGIEAATSPPSPARTRLKREAALKAAKPRDAEEQAAK